MSLVREIFCGGKLDIHTLGLKYDTDLAADGIGGGRHISVHDGGAAAAWEHQRGKNSEERRFAAAVGAKQSEYLRWWHVKRNFIKCNSVAIAVCDLRNVNRH